ncbi:MAG: hypothetical protein ACM31C_00620 [Acidobacteriota bacterium]
MGEWERRQLCPDGACIGVIGADGTCTVCGRAAPGYDGAYRSGPSEPIEDEDEAEAGDDADEKVQELVDKAEGAVHEVEWKQRELCPDGACTGVIGDDGKCKVCGRSAA